MIRQAKVHVALFLLLALPGAAVFGAEDKWLAPDKFQHLAVGAAAGGGVTALATAQRWGGDPRLWGTAAGCALGAAKELNDARHRDIHTPSWRDFAVTCAGAAAASYTMGWMLSRQPGGTTVVSWSKEF